MPRERPILFSGSMVRAILEGRKTQTRRAVKTPLHEPLMERAFAPGCGIWRGKDGSEVRCPYGTRGDRLWVKETFIHEPEEYCWEASTSVPSVPAHTIYRADVDPHGVQKGVGWRPCIFMPRYLSRIALEVVGVKVERLHDISEEDAKAEGVEAAPFCKAGRPNGLEHVESFEDLWGRINGPDSWAANPWVWCIGFRRLE